MVHVETFPLRFRVSRTVQVTWPEGDGPEVDDNGNPARLVRVSITYWTSEGRPWRGTTEVAWAHVIKDGLGEVRQGEDFDNHPQVQALVDYHRPTIGLRIVEDASDAPQPDGAAQ